MKEDIADIAVVIPAYKAADSICAVVNSIPRWIRWIIVVDDACPDTSGKRAASTGRENVIVLFHSVNQGVGGAVSTGYEKAFSLGAQIAVKMDADGQMDPSYLDALVRPILEDRADYTKGNRFRDFGELVTMPRFRLFGNSGLSFLSKAASGYWNIMDPTNGYTALSRRIYEELRMDSIATRYFFETDMLINLNIVGAVVRDVSMPARYGRERSSLDVRWALMHFPPKLLKGAVKRIFFRYFIYDFNMASIYLLLSLPIFCASGIYGIVEWIDSCLTGIPRSGGTIMLVALPIIISFQMLLQAISIDISSVPKKE